MCRIAVELLENNNIKSLRVSTKLWADSEAPSAACTVSSASPDGIHYHNLQHHKAICGARGGAGEEAH